MVFFGEKGLGLGVGEFIGLEGLRVPDRIRDSVFRGLGFEGLRLHRACSLGVKGSAEGFRGNKGLLSEYRTMQETGP